MVEPAATETTYPVVGTEPAVPAVQVIVTEVSEAATTLVIVGAPATVLRLKNPPVSAADDPKKSDSVML